MPLLYLILSIAMAQTDCPKESQAATVGKTESHWYYVSPLSGCVASIQPIGKTARKIDFLKNGEIYVHTPMGHGSGFRAIYILPATSRNPSVSSNSQKIQVTDTSGLKWDFDKSGQMSSVNGCKTQINSQSSAEIDSTDGGKPGGFFIKSCS